MFMDSTNKRVDEFMVETTSELTSLRDSLEFTQAELAKISHETCIALSRPPATLDFDLLVNNLHAMYAEKQAEYIDKWTSEFPCDSGSLGLKWWGLVGNRAPRVFYD